MDSAGFCGMSHMNRVGIISEKKSGSTPGNGCVLVLVDEPPLPSIMNLQKNLGKKSCKTINHSSALTFELF
jgi:hypothetical protein